MRQIHTMSRFFKNYLDKSRMSSKNSCKFRQKLVFSDFLTFVVNKKKTTMPYRLSVKMSLQYNGSNMLHADS